MNQLTLNGLVYGKFKNQSEMAACIGWSRQRLSKLLKKKKIPNIAEVDLLAKALGVPFITVAKFFLDSESPNGDQ